MARLKLAGDQARKLSGVRVMKDLKNHIKAFENDIDWPISYTDFLFSLLFLSLKHHNSIKLLPFCYSQVNGKLILKGLFTRLTLGWLLGT